MLCVNRNALSTIGTNLAAVVANGELRLYRDGQLVGVPTTMTGGVPIASGPLFFGGRGSAGDGYFRGWIDEVKLYKRALTQAELGALSVVFLIGVPLVLAASGMLIWWRRRRR